MVKFRGINVSIVSQFDIRKLPELSPRKPTDPFHHRGPALRSDDNSIASCYVPIYPGSQIWFEYSIDAPHPPDASYFFKMLHNKQIVTSWDCNGNHGYHGKMAYNLQYIGNNNFTGMPLVKRQAFKFSATDRNKDVGPFDDYIEIRVHRVEHRQRIPIASSTHDPRLIENDPTKGLCLINGGLLEPGYPQRRYRYQLLDPTDEPYATIRFYYRSYEFLEDQNIVPSFAKAFRPISPSSSGDWSERLDAPHERRINTQPANYSRRYSPRRAQSASMMPLPTCNFEIPQDSQQKVNTEPEEEMVIGQCPPPRNSDESLRIVAKDSLEELHASPRYVKENSSLPIIDDVKVVWNDEMSYASPKKLHKKPLTLKIDGADFELEKRKRRTLSPFTNTGALRRMISSTPPSAPAAATEFGPTVAEEVEAQLTREKERRKLDKAQVAKASTTRAERGGKMLLGFLEKRIGRIE